MRIKHYEYNVTTEQCIAEQCYYELEQIELETWRKYKNKKYTLTNNPNKDRDKNQQYQYLLRLFNYCTY